MQAARCVKIRGDLGVSKNLPVFGLTSANGPAETVPCAGTPPKPLTHNHVICLKIVLWLTDLPGAGAAAAAAVCHNDNLLNKVSLSGQRQDFCKI